MKNIFRSAKTIGRSFAVAQASLLMFSMVVMSFPVTALAQSDELEDTLTEEVLCEEGFELNENDECVEIEIPLEEEVILQSQNVQEENLDAPQSCSIVSNETDYVVTDNHNAVETFVHDAWDHTLESVADWIWGDALVQHPEAEEIKTFTKEFDVTGTPTSATLTLAVDNGAEVQINGATVLTQDPNTNNYNPTQTIDISAYLVANSVNTIEVTVTNLELTDNPTSERNPAGVIYKLDIEGSDCSELPYEEEEEPQEPSTSSVTMCKVKQDEGFTPLGGWTLMLMGDEVEDLAVPSGNSAGVDTSTSLTSGTSYLAVASGTWNNQGGNNPVDAEYSTNSNPAWDTHMDGYTGFGDGILELEINETDGDWGSYNASHQYAQSFTPSSSGSANFRIFDGDTISHMQNEGWFGDNDGSLAVSLYEGYAGVTDEETGCVTFNDVPYGEYSVGEINQAGWSYETTHDQRDQSEYQFVLPVNDPTETFSVINSEEEGDVEPETAMLHATKIVCEDESYLPNWGAGGADITGTTAAAFLASVNDGEAGEVCHLESDWSFEWVTDADSNTNPGDNIETAGAPWTTTGLTGVDGTVTTSVPAGGKVWVREVLKSNYIPFTGQNIDQAVSAEIYCSTDVLNYDNWDWIDPVQDGEEYHCIAFNAPLEVQACDVEAETVLLSSDAVGDTLVTEDEDGPASIVSFLHDAWFDAVDALWIWKDATTSEEDALSGTTETFTRTFNIVGTPLSATLELAADNGVVVMVNGEELVNDSDEQNYQTTVSYPIPSEMLQNGENEITFTVTNMDHSTENTPERNPAGLLYKITMSENECEVPQDPNAGQDKVHIFKFLSDGEFETQIPNDSTAPSFPMTSTWDTDNFGAGSGSYVLGNNEGGTALRYAADTSLMDNGSDYTTSEITDGSVVVPANSEECPLDKYRLVGYRYGDSLLQAQSASLSTTAPAFTNITTDKYVIVVNELCGTEGGGGNDDFGTLIINKIALGDNSTFNFSVDPEEGEALPVVVITTDGSGSAEEDLEEGWYDITETVPDGWTLQDSNCEYEGESEGISIENGESIYIEEGETVTCTFTNTKDGEPTSTSNTTIVSDNTSGGENLLGWMFNRDLSTQSPFEFNTNAAGLGSGSLFVQSITNTINGNNDKFIGELFLQSELSETDSISYEFQIGSPDATVEEQFYMNVYTTFGSSSPTKFYDCRYNVVPTTGSTGGFTTVTFDPSLTYPVATHGTSPFACPASPLAMDGLSAGSGIRVIALNVGDTSGSDTGVSGYLDEVIVTTTVGTNTHTETYDFEPVAPSNNSNGGGGGGGSRSSSSSNNDDDDGEVAGLSTENMCEPLLHSFLGLDYPNDLAEIIDLQGFLNEHMGAALPLSGVFGPMTHAAVHEFQQQYWEDVLQPWFSIPNSGILDADDSTGVVYKTTKWKINDIYCPGSESIPELP